MLYVFYLKRRIVFIFLKHSVFDISIIKNIILFIFYVFILNFNIFLKTGKMIDFFIVILVYFVFGKNKYLNWIF